MNNYSYNLHNHISVSSMIKGESSLVSGKFFDKIPQDYRTHYQ